MKKLYILTLLLTFLGLQNLSAQKEANNWYFGNGAGMTWNTTQALNVKGWSGTADAIVTGFPTQATGSSMRAVEGCFAMSDINGNILFYSNGATIYNREKKIMPNGTNLGLGKNMNSAQAGIIMPYPGNSDKYIAVTVSDYSTISNYGVLLYSVIDMTQDGGKGDVTQKNIPLLGAIGETTESVSSIPHANGTDYWIIAPGRYNDNSPTQDSYLHTWLVTSAGVQASSPATTIKLPVAVTFKGILGYFKFSPNRKYFAWGTGGSASTVYYGKFDAATGTFSDIKVLNCKHNYGIEFSPSGRYLYASSMDMSSGPGREGTNVYDFDALLKASDPNTVLPTKTYPIGGSLQLGPDRRIYMAPFAVVEDDTSIFFFDNPEEINNLKFYEAPDFFKGTYINDSGDEYEIGIGYGLPSFMANYFGTTSLSGTTEICLRDEAFLVFDVAQGVGADLTTNLKWDFGDGTPIITDDLNAGTIDVIRTHEYKQRGTYHVTATPFRIDGSPITENIKTMAVHVSNCAIPVNHIISHQNYGGTTIDCPKPKTPVITFDINPVVKLEGETFTASVSAASTDATATYTWSIANSATNGLSIQGTNTGTSVTIKSSKAGEFNASDIVVTAVNTCGFTQGFGEGTIKITSACVMPSPQIAFDKTWISMDNNEKTFVATVSETGTATGVTYEWSLTQTGIDAGFSISPTTGTTTTITCSKGGIINANVVTVTATNSCGSTIATGTGNLEIVCTKPSPTIVFDKRSINKDNNEYITLTVSGYVGTGATYAWSLTQAGIDAGLSLSSTTGSSVRITGSKAISVSASVVTVTVTNSCGFATAAGTGSNITVTVTPTTLNINCPAVTPTISGTKDITITPITVSIPYTITGAVPYQLTGTTSTYNGLTATVATQPLNLNTGGTIDVVITGKPTTDTGGLVPWAITIGQGQKTCNVNVSVTTSPIGSTCATEGKPGNAMVFSYNSKWYAVILGKLNGNDVAEVNEYSTEEEALRDPNTLQYCNYTNQKRCVAAYKRNGERYDTQFFTMNSISSGNNGVVAFSGCTQDMILYPGGLISYEHTGIPPLPTSGNIGVVQVGSKKYMGYVAGAGGVMTTKGIMY